ncbi:hypothetical protein KCTC32516_00399 [Polaribacter huanghezhanensis]|uniref:hypothetical protein n=1 Tax=Polaribacter huanghezhanensis TaxID=1354726 RepID=UPI0026482EF6|nr:hypothetical protein [Polaribacter huanghezhanensis]WKD85061.1 hypothetical protein KCTC32516_00399 [Polaribacter huanghezhanensis]
MKNIFILILIMSVFTNCKKDNSITPTIEVLKGVKKTINLSQISENQRIMVIKNHDFQMIGKVKRVQKLNNNLIVQSPSMISVIDSNGNIIKQLSVESEEVISPLKGMNEMKVFDGVIYVLDREVFKIYILDGNLNLKSSINLNFYCQSFEIINHNTFILYMGHTIAENNKGLFVVYNSKNNEIIDDLLPIDKNTTGYFNFLTSNHILKTSSLDYFYLWDSTKNYIYEYSLKNGIKNKFYINYANSGLPNDFYETSTFKNAFDFLSKTRKKSYAFRHFDFKSNTNYLSFIFEKEGFFISTLFNFKTGDVISYQEIKDDVFTNLSLDGLFFFGDLLDENSFVYLLPFELLSEIEDDSKLNVELKKAKAKNLDVLVFGQYNF